MSTAAQSVAVVRSTSPEIAPEVAADVDAALSTSLVDIAHEPDAIVAPTELEEIQLALGCDGFGRACLFDVAQALQVQTLVIRRLSVESDGRPALELMLFRADSGAEATAARSGDAAANQSTALAGSVPSLVRQIYGITEPAASGAQASASAQAAATGASASSEPAQDEASRRGGAGGRSTARVGLATWLVLIAGAATLVTGIVIGAGASADYDDYLSTPVRTVADARELQSQMDSIETRGTVANVLMPIGGALLGLGGVLLVLDLTRDGPSDEHAVSASLGVSPMPGGGLLTLRSRFGGLQ